MKFIGKSSNRAYELQTTHNERDLGVIIYEQWRISAPKSTQQLPKLPTAWLQSWKIRLPPETLMYGTKFASRIFESHLKFAVD